MFPRHIDNAHTAFIQGIQPVIGQIGTIFKIVSFGDVTPDITVSNIDSGTTGTDRRDFRCRMYGQIVLLPVIIDLDLIGTVCSDAAQLLISAPVIAVIIGIPF